MQRVPHVGLLSVTQLSGNVTTMIQTQVYASVLLVRLTDSAIMRNVALFPHVVSKLEVRFLSTCNVLFVILRFSF